MKLPNSTRHHLQPQARHLPQRMEITGLTNSNTQNQNLGCGWRKECTGFPQKYCITQLSHKDTFDYLENQNHLNIKTRKKLEKFHLVQTYISPEHSEQNPQLQQEKSYCHHISGDGRSFDSAHQVAVIHTGCTNHAQLHFQQKNNRNRKLRVLSNKKVSKDYLLHKDDS